MKTNGYFSDPLLQLETFLNAENQPNDIEILNSFIKDLGEEIVCNYLCQNITIRPKWKYEQLFSGFDRELITNCLNESNIQGPGLKHVLKLYENNLIDLEILTNNNICLILYPELLETNNILKDKTLENIKTLPFEVVFDENNNFQDFKKSRKMLFSDTISKAVMMDNLDLFNKLVIDDSSFDVNAVHPFFYCLESKKPFTLISIAAISGSLNCFKKLLEMGANINDNKTFCPANCAVISYNLDILKIILKDNGRLFGIPNYAVTFHHNDIFDYFDEQMDLVGYSDENEKSSVVDSNKSKISFCLLCAIQNNNCLMISHILSLMNHHKFKLSSDLKSACLQTAIQGGNPECINLFIRIGASIPDDKLSQLLAHSIAIGSCSRMKSILIYKNDQTLLSILEKRSIPLLKTFAELKPQLRSNIMSYIFQNFSCITLETMKILVSLGIVVKNSLPTACLFCKNSDIIEFLIECGADVNTPSEIDGKYNCYPLEAACFASNIDAVNILLKYKASPDNGIFCSPLEALSTKIKLNIPINQLTSKDIENVKIQIAQTLLTHGANINYGIRKKPIEAAQNNDNKGLISFFTSNGADVK